MSDLVARLKRLLKKCAKDAPRGLKSARRIEDKRLIGTTKVMPPDTKPARNEFSATCEAVPFQIGFETT